MNRPLPTRAYHAKFCSVEGWEQVRNARGGTGTHHVIYELVLPDGKVLRTRIPHPVDRTGYGASMWSHILRDQLDVTEDAFWRCVLDGEAPTRARPEQPVESLPADLVFLLVHRVGLSESEISAMDRNAAINRIQRFWTEGR